MLSDRADEVTEGDTQSNKAPGQVYGKTGKSGQQSTVQRNQASSDEQPDAANHVRPDRELDSQSEQQWQRSQVK